MQLFARVGTVRLDRSHIRDVDVVELNEGFAAQAVAVVRDAKLVTQRRRS